MSTTWSDFVQTNLSNDADTGVVALTDHEIIRITGPDSEKFLQGQLTCDMRKVRADGSGLGAHCSIKGKMLSLFRLIAQEDGFLLRIHGEVSDSALSNLGKYIIFSKAKLSREEAFAGLGFYGKCGQEQLLKMGFELPHDLEEVAYLDPFSLVKVPGERYELWGPVDQLIDKIGQTDSQLSPLNEWLLKEIAAGIPDLRAQTLDTFLPQMTNLQAVEGVSFTKGCYTGQEVVTRLQHRGKLNKAMYRLFVAAQITVAPGAVINSDEREDIGNVVFSAQREDGVEMLAVVHHDQAETRPLTLQQHPELTLEKLHLPYTLDEKMFERKEKLL